LRRGNTYIFSVNFTVKDYSFILTEDPIGGKNHVIGYNLKCLEGTRIIRHGETLELKVTKNTPSNFYYQCVEYQMLGGNCSVHDQ
jgi:hypothetical protein